MRWLSRNLQKFQFDPENKGLGKFDPDNKGLIDLIFSVSRPPAADRCCKKFSLILKIKDLSNLILITKDLAKRDPENKGLIKLILKRKDLDRKGSEIHPSFVPKSKSS